MLYSIYTQFFLCVLLPKLFWSCFSQKSVYFHARKKVLAIVESDSDIVQESSWSGKNVVIIVNSRKQRYDTQHYVLYKFGNNQKPFEEKLNLERNIREKRDIKEDKNSTRRIVARLGLVMWKTSKTVINFETVVIDPLWKITTVLHDYWKTERREHTDCAGLNLWLFISGSRNWSLSLSRVWQKIPHNNCRHQWRPISDRLRCHLPKNMLYNRNLGLVVTGRFDSTGKLTHFKLLIL